MVETVNACALPKLLPFLREPEGERYGEWKGKGSAMSVQCPETQTRTTRGRKGSGAALTLVGQPEPYLVLLCCCVLLGERMFRVVLVHTTVA